MTPEQWQKVPPMLESLRDTPIEAIKFLEFAPYLADCQ